jgi:hypothetical protein
VPWTRIEQPRDALETCGIDWRDVQRKQAAHDAELKS